MTTTQAARTATQILADIVAFEAGPDATDHIVTTASGAAVISLPEADNDMLAAGVRLYLDDTDLVIIGLDSFGAEISRARLSGRAAEQTAHLIIGSMIADSLAGL